MSVIGIAVGSSMMASNSKRDSALSLLFEQSGEKIVDLKFFVDSTKPKTENDLWDEIHSFLIEEKMGRAVVSKEYDDDAPEVNAVAFLNSL